MGLVDLNALRQGAGVLRTTEIEVPAWGGSVRLRELTGAQRSEMIAQAIDLGKGLANADGMPSGAGAKATLDFAVAVIAATWVDGDGNLVITDAAGRALLHEQPFGVLLELSGAALRLSNMHPGAVEDAKKNSLSSQTPGSGTN